jgi:hypothetical protein
LQTGLLLLFQSWTFFYFYPGFRLAPPWAKLFHAFGMFAASLPTASRHPTHSRAESSILRRLQLPGSLSLEKPEGEHAKREGGVAKFGNCQTSNPQSAIRNPQFKRRQRQAARPGPVRALEIEIQLKKGFPESA